MRPPRTLRRGRAIREWQAAGWRHVAFDDGTEIRTRRVDGRDVDEWVVRPTGVGTVRAASGQELEDAMGVRKEQLTRPVGTTIRRSRMHANENGIALTKAELRALREFAAKEETDRNRYGVQFETKGNRVFARATDGRRCVEFEGINDGLHVGEWFVGQKFLIDGRKELEGKQVLRLCFKGASLHEAVVEENGITRLTLTSEQDEAVAQTSFPEIAKTIKIPGPRRERPHCVTLAEGHMRAVQLAALAVEEEMVDWFPPAEADGLLVFRIAHDKQTSCIGAMRANLSAESIVKASAIDEDDEEDDEDERPKRSRKKNGRQQDLPGAEA